MSGLSDRLTGRGYDGNSHVPLVALGNAFPSAQLGNRILSAQPFQDDADLLFRTIALAGLAADLTDMLLGRRLRPGF